MKRCSCDQPSASPTGCGVTSYSPVAMPSEFASQLCAALAYPGEPTVETRAKIEIVEIDSLITPQLLRPYRELLESARLDSQISEVWLPIRSPGGFAEGVAETHAAIKRLAKAKPVHVFGEGLLCSAAYWIASAATKVYASPSCIVGSCGAISVLVDDSAMFEAMGLKVIPVSSAAAKQIGLPGVPISEDDVARVQRRIDEAAAMFKGDVERDRRMSKNQVNEAFAEADVYHGAEAHRRGYVDAVWTLEEALADHPRHELGYLYLGDSAVAEFQRLVAAETGAEYFFDASAEDVAKVRERHPQLAKAADQATAARIENGRLERMR